MTKKSKSKTPVTTGQGIDEKHPSKLAQLGTNHPLSKALKMIMGKAAYRKRAEDNF